MVEILPLLRRYLSLLVQACGPLAMTGAMGLVLACGLTDGVGLVLLVPLLESLNEPAAQSGPAQAIGTVLNAMGLTPSLTTLLLVFLALVILRSALIYGRDITMTRLRLTLVSTLRVRLYGAIAKASWPFLASRRQSDLAASLLTEMDRIGQGTFFALQCPARLVSLAAHVVVAFALAPLFSLLALATGLGLAWLLRSHLGRSLALGRSLTTANRALHGEVAEFLAGIKLTKAHANEDRHVAAFSRRIHTVTGQIADFSRATARNRLAQDVFGAAALTVFLFTGANLVHLPTAQLLLLALIFYRLLPQTQDIQQATQQILHMLPSLQSVLSLCRDCELQAEQQMAAPALPAFPCDISLRDVWFRHGGDASPWILQGLDLALAANSLTVISGPSGSGKSTLLDLLVGLQVPTKGEILINGIPHAAQSPLTWRQSLAYLPQEAFLFHDSIRANLLWARPDASDADMAAALTAAGAASFVATLPQGVDTMVGDRGIRLSGGERQRLALARALLRQPTLLLLDEATTGLDSANERLVLDAIEALRGRMTIVAVTHQPDIFRHAGQKLIMADGRLYPLAARMDSGTT